MEYYKNPIYQAMVEHLCQTEIDWGQFHNKKILITGASGMVGTLLIEMFMKRNELYQDNICVYAVSRNEKKLHARFDYLHAEKYLVIVPIDVRSQFQFDEKLDYIIHAASNTHPYEYSHDPVGTITTNILGFYHLLEMVKDRPSCKVLFLSSVEIYGENRGDVERFSEEYCGYIDCNTLRSGYPESKRTCEAMLQAYISQYQLHGVIVRLPRLYGATLERDDTKALSQFLFKAIDGKNIVLKSKGNQFFSYLYVADAVKAMLYVLAKGENGATYNAADTESDITLADLAGLVAELTGTNVEYDIPDEAETAGYSKATKAVLNAERLRKLGWCAEYTIRSGIKDVITILR